MSTGVPNTMYELYGVQKSNLDKKRQAFVKLVAAQIATINWMADPKNADKVAQYATVVGAKKDVLLKAMVQYRTLNFWSADSPGMPAQNVQNTIDGQVAAGNIKAAQAPKAQDLIDTSVYADAEKLVKAKS